MIRLTPIVSTTIRLGRFLRQVLPKSEKGSHERPTERTARAGMPDSSTVWTRVVCNDLLKLPGLSVFPAWLSSYLLPWSSVGNHVENYLVPLSLIIQLLSLFPCNHPHH